MHENMVHPGHLRIPRVLVLQLYNRMPMGRIRFLDATLWPVTSTPASTATLYPKVTLNMDHVIPRAQGGTTQWENAVTSCGVVQHPQRGKNPHQEV